MLRQISLLILLLTCLMSISTFAQNDNIISTNGLKIKKQTFADENKARMFKLEAKYPQLVDTNSATAPIFNQKAKELALGKLKEFENRMAELTSEDLKDVKESGITNYSDITYVIELATDSVISVRFDNRTYAGGVHPDLESFTFNFNLAKGKEIKLADLFTSGSGYLKRISSYAVADLKKQLTEFLDEESINEGAGPSTENFNSWNITKNGLKLNFDPYQVAAYAAGSQTVTIPFEEIDDIFKKVGK